jgi:hypothetical protein
MRDVVSARVIPMRRSPDTREEILKGEVVDYEDASDWFALENVIELDVCDGFMYMCKIELEDGTILHNYKHHWNRRSLHLSAQGDAFFYIWKEGDFDPDAPGEYRRVPLHEALAAVLGRPCWPEHEQYERDVARLRDEMPDMPETDEESLF